MYGVFLAIGDRREPGAGRAVVERERGFRLVGEAGDGATAFAMIRDIQPDVVIAELRMPFVDGAALCRGLRRSFPWMESLIVGARNDALFAGALNEAELERSLSTPITALAPVRGAASRGGARRRGAPGHSGARSSAAAEQDPSEHPGAAAAAMARGRPSAARRVDSRAGRRATEGRLRRAAAHRADARCRGRRGHGHGSGRGHGAGGAGLRRANIARFSLGDVMGFRPQIYVSSEETDAVGMRRALEELRARGASPKPGWLILGMDDRPRRCGACAFPSRRWARRC